MSDCQSEINDAVSKTMLDMQDKCINELVVTEIVYPDRSNEINLVGVNSFDIKISPPDHLTVSIKPMLFAWFHYNSKGGWDDFIGFFDNISDAKKHIFEEIKDGASLAHIIVNGKKVCNAIIKTRYPSIEWEFEDVADEPDNAS